MMKRGRSKSAFTNISKKARIGPYSSHSPSPGPSRLSEEQMQVSSPVPADDVDIASMEISPSALSSRLLLPELPSRVKKFTEFISSKDYQTLHTYIISQYFNAGVPEVIVSLDVFMQNVTCKNATDFRDLVNKAVTEKDWENVITHGMCLALSS
jgi:hypothetical protein